MALVLVAHSQASAEVVRHRQKAAWVEARHAQGSQSEKTASVVPRSDGVLVRDEAGQEGHEACDGHVDLVA